jgi:hypothetical protein
MLVALCLLATATACNSGQNVEGALTTPVASQPTQGRSDGPLKADDIAATAQASNARPLETAGTGGTVEGCSYLKQEEVDALVGRKMNSGQQLGPRMGLPRVVSLQARAYGCWYTSGYEDSVTFWILDYHDMPKIDTAQDWRPTAFTIQDINVNDTQGQGQGIGEQAFIYSDGGAIPTWKLVASSGEKVLMLEWVTRSPDPSQVLIQMARSIIARW